MVEIEIYTTNSCPYCVKAKNLLDKKSLKYKEVNVGFDENKWSEMISRSGGKRTVPQIFIGGVSIGGCDELYALERSGKLDGMV